MTTTLSNTTVLSNFAAVGRLDLLRALFGRVHISNEVYEEILNGLDEGYDFYSGIDEHVYPISKTGWIVLVAMDGDVEAQLFRSLPRQLHFGEASCLAIAQRRGWAFLTDDRFARKTARARGIIVSGTLGVLVRAVKASHLTVDHADDLLREMIQRGYRSPYLSLVPLLDMG